MQNSFEKALRVLENTKSVGEWSSSWWIHSFPIFHWSPRKVWIIWILPPFLFVRPVSRLYQLLLQNVNKTAKARKLLVCVMFWVTSCVLHLILKSLFANVQILSQFRLCWSFRKPSSFIFQFFSNGSDMIGFEPATSTNVSDSQIVSCTSIFCRLYHSVWKCFQKSLIFKIKLPLNKVEMRLFWTLFKHCASILVISRGSKAYGYSGKEKGPCSPASGSRNPKGWLIKNGFKSWPSKASFMTLMHSSMIKGSKKQFKPTKSAPALAIRMAHWPRDTPSSSPLGPKLKSSQILNLFYSFLCFSILDHTCLVLFRLVHSCRLLIDNFSNHYL